MPLPATPWLRGPDAGALYLKGMSLGAQVAAQRQRAQQSADELSLRSTLAAQQTAQHMAALDQRNHELDVESQLKREALEMETVKEQQRLAIQDDYRKAQMELSKQRIAQAQAQQQFRVDQAARSFAARQKFTQRTQEGGEDPVSVALSMAGELNLPGGSIAALSNASKPQVPPDLQIQRRGDEAFYLNGRTWVHIPRVKAPNPDALSQKDRAELSQLNAERKQQEAALNSWAMRSALAAPPLESIVDPDQRQNVKTRLDQARQIQGNLDRIKRRQAELIQRTPVEDETAGEEDLLGDTGETGEETATHTYDPATGRIVPITTE